VVYHNMSVMNMTKPEWRAWQQALVTNITTNFTAAPPEPAPPGVFECLTAWEEWVNPRCCPGGLTVASGDGCGAGLPGVCSAFCAPIYLKWWRACGRTLENATVAVAPRPVGDAGGEDWFEGPWGAAHIAIEAEAEAVVFDTLLEAMEKCLGVADDGVDLSDGCTGVVREAMADGAVRFTVRTGAELLEQEDGKDTLSAWVRRAAPLGSSRPFLAPAVLGNLSGFYDTCDRTVTPESLRAEVVKAMEGVLALAEETHTPFQVPHDAHHSCSDYHSGEVLIRGPIMRTAHMVVVTVE
jgi:hypothetical protein